MEYEELYAAIQSTVDSLGDSNPGEDFSDCSHLLDHGEAQEAMDVLIATLVRFNIPVTRAQQSRIRELMGEFELTDEARGTYRYLADSEMLDRMNVVDEPRSS